MIKEVDQKKMIECMKAGDKENKGFYSNVVQAIKNKEIALRGKGEMTEQDELDAVSKLVKTVQEQIDTAPADRVEAIAGFKRELEVYKSFLPAQMTDEEIKGTIEKVLTDLGIIESATNKDKGKIMKVLMPLIKGKADGSKVNKMLATYMK